MPARPGVHQPPRAGVGRPPSPYISEAGHVIAVKLQDGIQPQLEMLALRRQASADQVVAALIGEAAREDLGGIAAALDRLAHALAFAQGMHYDEASALFQRLDGLHEQMEALLCAAPDYPK